MYPRCESGRFAIAQIQPRILDYRFGHRTNSVVTICKSIFSALNGEHVSNLNHTLRLITWLGVEEDSCPSESTRIVLTVYTICISRGIPPGCRPFNRGSRSWTILQKLQLARSVGLLWPYFLILTPMYPKIPHDTHGDSCTNSWQLK